MSTYSLKVISSDGVFYDGKVMALILPGIDGETELLAHHEEIVVAVKTGAMKYQTPDEVWHEAAVGIGSAQFANNRCTVLVDTAERPEDIDANRAKAALERAREQMRQIKSIDEYRVTQASMARALTRLRLTNK
jgi:F-type H+-transporting ATPase subunit epsilon